MMPVPVVSSNCNSPTTKPTDIPRRPSPWHDLAHSLTETKLASTSNTSSPSPSTSPSSPAHTPRHRLSISASQTLQRLGSSGSLKVAAESDREGFIEYKLKLIDPSGERFERLVTQLMWRLKQGRNEAIYEIGLADDGTVIGLTRQEMNASLSTLEQMASEVGATVIILKEIILTGVKRPESMRKCWEHGDASIIGSGNASAIGSQARPKPRPGGRRDRRWNGAEEASTKLTSRPILFNRGEVENDQYGDDEEVVGDIGEKDIPPFQLDLDDLPETPTTSSPPALSEQSLSTGRDAKVYKGRWKKTRKKPPPKPVPAEDAEEKRRKAEAKSVKAAQKREARRLDLLRGDGMSPVLSSLMGGSSSDSESMASSFESGISIPAPITRGLKVPNITSVVVGSSRPSSLRLSTPVSSPEKDHTAIHDKMSNGNDDGEDEDPDNDSESDSKLINDLLHLPLDSLSLSFADVRTIKAGSPLASPSSSSSTEIGEVIWAGDVEDELGEYGRGEGEGRDGEMELLCVEALVVRKVNHDEEEEIVDGAEDVWGFGGGEEEYGNGGFDFGFDLEDG